MNNSPNIGIFDSGIGGLTVLKEVRRLLPAENIVYFGDTARLPYGTKSADTIRGFASRIIDFLLRQRVKLIIAACNSVSALALDYLVKKYRGLPVFGVVHPGAEAACAVSRSGRIGVIGTPATVASGSYRKSILKRNPRARVVQQACPLFVPIVENGWALSDVAVLTARKYLAPLKKRNIDTLVLGCTHYPLLMPVLRRIMGNKVKLVDSATVTARKVRDHLKTGGMERAGRAAGKTQYWLSDSSEYFIRSAKLVLREPTIRIRLEKL